MKGYHQGANQIHRGESWQEHMGDWSRWVDEPAPLTERGWGKELCVGVEESHVPLVGERGG